MSRLICPAQGFLRLTLVEADPHREYPSMAVVQKRCLLAKYSAFLTDEGNALVIQQGTARSPACLTIEWAGKALAPRTRTIMTYPKEAVLPRDR